MVWQCWEEGEGVQQQRSTLTPSWKNCPVNPFY